MSAEFTLSFSDQLPNGRHACHIALTLSDAELEELRADLNRANEAFSLANTGEALILAITVYLALAERARACKEEVPSE